MTGKYRSEEGVWKVWDIIEDKRREEDNRSLQARREDMKKEFREEGTRNGIG